MDNESNVLFSMKKPFSHLLLGTAFLVGVGLPITSVHAETIFDAVQEAITSHPSVTGAQAAKDASAQGVREERSAYYPELSANATGGRVYGDNATSRGLSVTRGAGYSGFGEGSASLTQRIYDWGETSNKVDAATARDHEAESQITGTRETAGLHAAQAYIALLRATKLKAAGADNLAIIDGYQKKIETQVKEGGSDEAELNRANDFLLLAQNAATEFDGQYQQALADYMEATGGKPGADLTRPPMPASLPNTLDKAIQQAFDTHPQVVAAKQAIVAADHDIHAQKSMYLPKISAQGSYLKRDEADIIGGEAIDARAVLKADWNYSTGGAELARVARAEAAKAQAQAQLDETYRKIEHDVRVSWSALDVVRQQEKTQADRKTATSKVVDTYKTQYEGGGQRKLIELMQAESQAFDASVAYDNADLGVLNASYTLMAAMGELVSGIQQSSTQVASVEPAPAPVAPSPAPVVATPVAPVSAPVADVTPPTAPVATSPQKSLGEKPQGAT